MEITFDDTDADVDDFVNVDGGAPVPVDSHHVATGEKVEKGELVIVLPEMDLGVGVGEGVQVDLTSNWQRQEVYTRI